MNSSARTTMIFAAILATAGVATPARALEQGMTQQSQPYMSGGVSIEEVDLLESRRSDYQLWLVTADQVSGTWLAGAQVSIHDAKRTALLDARLDGPYLFAALLPGRYSIDVTLEGVTQRSSVLTSGRGLQQVVTRLKTGVDVSPEMPGHPLAKASLAKSAPVSATKSVGLAGCAAGTGLTSCPRPGCNGPCPDRGRSMGSCPGES